MPSTKDIILGENFKGLFIGQTGTRKTVSAGSWYEQGPVYVFDFDHKVDVLKEIYPEADVEYDTYNSENYHKFIPVLREKCNSGKYRTVIVDSYTALTSSVIIWGMNLRQGGSERKITKSGVMTPSWDEFNLEANDTGKLIEIMQMAKCNFILTAHPIKSTQITPDGAKIVESIATAGKKGPELVPPLFKEVYYFRMETGLDANSPPYFIVQTQPSSECFARTNLGLPPKIKLQNDKSLYKLIQELKRK